LPPDRLVGGSLPSVGTAESPAALVRAAVAQPLGYPPLSQSILPGDRVTIALDPELPQLVIVADELLRDLLSAGVEPSQITMLVARSQQRDQLHAAWSDAWRSEMQLIVHDADDETTHAYLAATREGLPVYLNRAIGDADVFLPVGVQHLETALRNRGVHGGWFPAFSNLETQLRHQSPGNLAWQAHARRRQQETAEAAWLLGVRLIVQVLPGPEGSVAGVWCGDAEEVSRAASSACRQLWLQEVDRPAELVIAMIDSAASEQSWSQFAQALSTAARAVVDQGVIVLWTELSADPGPALKSLATFEASEDEQRLGLLKQRSADATAAKIIADSLDRCRIYLHSRLEDAVVEEIGLGPLHDVQELQRLADSAGSCLVINSAQHAGIELKQPVEA
jgi:nickel-dependent lactate racemase